MLAFFVAFAIFHIALEAIEDLAGFFNSILQLARRPWLPAALFGGAFAAVVGPFILAELAPALAPQALMFAGGAMLGDAILTHLAGSWIANRWAPATWTAPLQILAGSYLITTSPASLWWALPAFAAFGGLWAMLLVLARRDEAARACALTGFSMAVEFDNFEWERLPGGGVRVIKAELRSISLVNPPAPVEKDAA